MRDKVYHFLSDRVVAGDHITVAVSGGKDSMALLHAVWSLRERLGITVSSAHYNHGIRGREADRDAQFVEDFCNASGIPVILGSGDAPGYAQEHHVGLETAARILRYAFLESCSGKLVTAHTASDNLETILMNMLRGTGLHGLAGIPPERGKILRPMLEVSYKEIMAYLEDNRIPYVLDTTNLQDDCQRNRIRHHVIPSLEEENPALYQTITRLSAHLRMEDAYIQHQTMLALEQIRTDNGWNRKELQMLPDALQYRVIMELLQPVPQLARVHIHAALRLAKGNTTSGTLSLPGGFRWRCSYNNMELILEQEDTPSDTPIQIFPGMEVVFGGWRIACFWGEASRDLIAIYTDVPPEGFLLRSRKPGDRILLPGGTKKISRLLIDEKIPVDQRDEIPILCAGEEILAVLPIKISAGCRPKPNQRSIVFRVIPKEVKV